MPVKTVLCQKDGPSHSRNVFKRISVFQVFLGRNGRRVLQTKEENGNLEGYQQQVALKTCLQKEWDKFTPERLHHLVSVVPKRFLSVMVTGKCFTVRTFFVSQEPKFEYMLILKTNKQTP